METRRFTNVMGKDYEEMSLRDRRRLFYHYDLLVLELRRALTDTEYSYLEKYFREKNNILQDRYQPPIQGTLSSDIMRLIDKISKPNSLVDRYTDEWLRTHNESNWDSINQRYIHKN